MYDKRQFYLFSKIVINSNIILVAIEYYKQKNHQFPDGLFLTFSKTFYSLRILETQLKQMAKAQQQTK